MTLTDASPLVALINAKDKNHARCLAVLPVLSAPLLTTWPAFTEAMYLLSSVMADTQPRTLSGVTYKMV
ncbi:MAG: domain protein like [Chthonomonadaceae bacterium]|nr:domain protein like [Chthonomonadaceae bacterium]